MTSIHLKRAQNLTRLLEHQFQIGRLSFGLDPILGLFPGVGDMVPALLSFYILFIAILHKLPPAKLFRIIWNIMVDYVIGSIPLVGDLLDFAIQPNTKNLKILKDHIDRQNGILEGEVL